MAGWVGKVLTPASQTAGNPHCPTDLPFGKWTDEDSCGCHTSYPRFFRSGTAAAVSLSRAAAAVPFSGSVSSVCGCCSPLVGQRIPRHTRGPHPGGPPAAPRSLRGPGARPVCVRSRACTLVLLTRTRRRQAGAYRLFKGVALVYTPSLLQRCCLRAGADKLSSHSD